MKLAVVGTGYVGLVAGACFADSGNDVWCVDIDESKVARLRRGEPTIYEPGLDSILRRNLDEERLRFTTDLALAVRSADIIFMAVGTPPSADGSADMSQVWSAAEAIGKAMNGFKFVVNKSTVPLGTSDEIARILRANTSHEFEIVANPEFLKEGTAIDDFMRPDRVVIGAASSRARDALGELYAPFVRNNNPILFMDIRSAELTKYASNSMLALRISFMNELARLAEIIGADIDIVRKGMGADARIGKQFLFAGVGYGGSCFPKDVKALVRTGRSLGVPLTILEAADDVNEAQKRLLFEKIHRHFGGELRGRRIAVWGLAFKPNTDDLREAPSIVLIRQLLEAGAIVTAHDPVAMKAAAQLFGSDVSMHKMSFDAAREADALAIVTEWNEFRSPDFGKLKSTMAQPVIFDGRNILSPEKMRALGFTYYSIGRP